MTTFLDGKDASKIAAAYLQMSRCLMRLVYCTDSGVRCSMEVPGDAVHQGLERFERTAGDREM